MYEFRLEDIGIILSALLFLVAGLFCTMALIVLWPKISQITVATWHRYVVFSWNDLTEWLADRQMDDGVVNDIEYAIPVVMSRQQENASVVPLSGLRQTTLQTDNTSDRQPTARFSRNEILDICRLLREYGVPREKARQVLKSIMPIDNNLWVEAASPLSPEPEYTTPIAQRPTRAQFETDPELIYQQPPQ